MILDSTLSIFQWFPVVIQYLSGSSPQLQYSFLPRLTSPSSHSKLNSSSLHQSICLESIYFLHRMITRSPFNCLSTGLTSSDSAWWLVSVASLCSHSGLYLDCSCTLQFCIKIIHFSSLTLLLLKRWWGHFYLCWMSRANSNGHWTDIQKAIEH